MRGGEEGERRGVVRPVLSQVKRDDGSEGENGEAKERASGEKLRIEFELHGDSDTKWLRLRVSVT